MPEVNIKTVRTVACPQFDGSLIFLSACRGCKYYGYETVSDKVICNFKAKK